MSSEIPEPINPSANPQPPKWEKRIGKFLAAWLGLSLVYFAIFLTFGEFQWQFVYYYVWLLVFGLPLWIFREPVRRWLVHWPAPGVFKFLSLAYGMVLLEEIFAALFNHLSEGFNLWLYLQRIGQFWLFNIFAFTGLIFAVWYLFNRFDYSFGEMFGLAGLTGLYSERIIFLLPAQWPVFIVFAPIMLFTYGLILSPALLSVAEKPRRKLPFLLRLMALFVVWYLFSQLPVLLLTVLRTNYPLLFPPCQFISCG